MAKPVIRRTTQPAIYRLLTPRQINRQASQQAAATLAAQQEPILTQQRYADARAAAARQAMASAGAAASKLLSGVGAQNAQAYDQAVNETQNLVGGLSGDLGKQMSADQAAQADFRSQMAPGSASQEQVKPEDAQNAVYDAGAVIPGSSLAAQGAAATAYGNELPAIPQARALSDESASVGQQGLDDQQYVQQLLDLANQQPQVRAQILDQLYQTEASKANAITQEQAQQLYGAQFGEKVKVDQANIAQGNARIRQGQVRLQLQQQGLRLRQQSQALAVKKAQIDWNSVDPSKSKATGYLTNGQGQPILDKNGKKIPVAASSGSSAGKGTGQGTKAYQSAIGYAQGHFIGTPVANPAYVPGVQGVPKYLKKGGGYTDDPNQAQTSYDETFVQAQTYLMNRYGLSKKQARKVLVTLGRKPDGKRP